MSEGVIIAIIGAGGVIIAAFIGLFAKLKKSDPSYEKNSNKTIKKLKTLDNFPSYGYIVGRKSTARELLKNLKKNRIVFVQGVGGIGKSTITNYVARKYGSRHRCYLIWTSAKNELLTLDKILDTIASVLGFSGLSTMNVDEKSIEILKVLKQKKTVLVVDNFEDIENDQAIISFLKKVDDNCKIIITSRNNSIVSNDQIVMKIDVLSFKDSCTLMKKELTRNNRPFLSDENCQKLYEKVGGSPLAIRWAIGQIISNGHTVESICSYLSNAHASTEMYDLFKDIFEVSWKSLSKAQKEILYNLQFYVTPVSQTALFKVSGSADINRFREDLGKLLRLSLIDYCMVNSEGDNFYSMHSLTNSFVLAELKGKSGNADCKVVQKILRNYKEFCERRCMLPHGRSKDYGDIERELSNILKSINYLLENDNRIENSEQTVVKQNILDLCKAINVFLWSRGHWQERIDVCGKAYQIAVALGNNIDAAKMACYIGVVYFWQGQNDNASKYANIADEMLKGCALSEKILVHRLIALTEMGDKKYDEAIEKLINVLQIIQDVEFESSHHDDIAIIADWKVPKPDGYKAGQISLMQEIGICYNRKGEYQQAIPYLENSESLARSIEDDEGLAVSLSHLGHALFGLNKYKEAKRAYKEGLKLAIYVERKSTMARCYEGLTKVAKKQRNYVAMFVNRHKAIELFEQLNMQAELDDMKNIVAKNKNFIKE